jgi:hypothetical protein
VAAAAELSAARLAAAAAAAAAAASTAPSSPATFEETLYENTLTSGRSRGLRGDTDLYIAEEAPKSTSDYGSHGGDDRSSGYRSSSSPSIQSTEELYVNESAIASLEELNAASSPEPVTRSKTSRIIAETFRYVHTRGADSMIIRF